MITVLENKVSNEKKHQVVKLLEDYLELAKKGCIEEILVVADRHDLDVLDYAYTRCEDITRLVGMLEKLKYAQLKRMDVIEDT